MILLERCGYSRKYSVTIFCSFDRVLELRNITNISDKVTEVGEKLIQFRIMKS